MCPSCSGLFSRTSRERRRLKPSEVGAPAVAQASKKITFLTWNLVHLEAPLKGWIAGFIKSRPGVEVEWIDKKGPELPAYYQTQLAANT